jgi:threonine synthase
MGLPIAQLCVATNENDILDRFFASGNYAKHALPPKEASGGIKEDGAKAHEDGAKETLSPAMDILVSSNFERLLWYLALQNETSSPAEASKKLAGWMDNLKTQGSMQVSQASLEASKKLFTSARVSDGETLATIKEVYAKSSSKEIIDPHTAVGVKAALALPSKENAITITLATAHPAKFANAVDLALQSFEGYSFEKDVEPKEFKGLSSLERRVEQVQGVGQGRSKVMAYVQRLHDESR